MDVDREGTLAKPPNSKGMSEILRKNEKALHRSQAEARRILQAVGEDEMAKATPSSELRIFENENAM